MPAKHVVTSIMMVALAYCATAAFNTSCSWWYLHDQVTLTADCIDQTSSNRHRVVSSLDLNLCIGVDETANAMVWQSNGQAFRKLCSNCGMQSSEVVMQCDCASLITGGKTSSSVNLNDRINVDDEGWLTC